MRIGLDIDNVVSDFDKKMMEEFLKEDRNKRNKGVIHPDGNWVKDLFDWSREEVNAFYIDHMENFAKDLEPREGAIFYMNKLLEEKHQLYLISNRVYPHYNDPEKVTVEWLKKYEIPYTKLILSKTTDKSIECKENNIDVMFDDVQSNCHKLEQNHIRCYLMGTEYNRRSQEGLKRVEDWKELYEVVRNMSKKKVILDTDMFNEIDDQFALTYLLKSLDVFDLQAITIAPFSNSGYANTQTIQEGTEKSYDVTLKILDMLDFASYKDKVYKGSTTYFKETQESNPAVDKIIEIAHRNDKTILLAIGAITNVALAIQKDPTIVSKIKVVWLGGNSFLTKNNNEFNFRQDIPAVQMVFDSQVELTVIPCRNVASNLTTTIYELNHYLKEDNPINNYLKQIFMNCKKHYQKSKEDAIGSSKTLWDLSAIAYEINADWFQSEWISCPKVEEDGTYVQMENTHKVLFVNDLSRNKIFQDFFIKMGCNNEDE